MKSEATSRTKENYFMLDNSYREETIEELTVVVMLGRIEMKQLSDGNAERVPSDDAKSCQADKDTIEIILKEKDKIQSDFFKIENEKLIIQHETQLAKKAFKERENRYLENIVDLEEKLSSHDRIVYKIAGLGYKNPERLKKAIAAQPKMYDGERLDSAKLTIDSPDSEETLEDAKESRLKMRNKMFYKTDVIPMSASLSKNLKELKEELIKEKNELLKAKLEKSSSDSKDIQANLLKRIKILENDFKRSQAQSIDFELKLQHQKEKMACDVSWKSKLSTINDENVLLKTQVDSVVKERENIKLEYQKLFNSIKATQTQHQKELDELIEHVNQKTYAYADVRAQNQDLLITIYELKNKLQTIDKGKNVNTKFDKSETSGTLLCVTPLPKNIAVKAKKVSNTKVNTDRSKPVTSHLTPKNEQSRKHNENVLARGMWKMQSNGWKVNQIEYYATSPPEVSDNSAANTLDNKDTSSSSSIVVEEDEAPQIVSSSAEQVASEPNTLVLNENADELVQEDVAELDKNVFYNLLPTPVIKEAESSSTY
ncbi:hypothetical protein Tco_0988629 [Tanacetum coccineum]|uniref:Uncharacterized protein n=1 Tax=Tanacetum coccineum TaxID=301880 RepID=A0ABQ5ERH4_9ASTR